MPGLLILAATGRAGAASFWASGARCRGRPGHGRRCRRFWRRHLRAAAASTAAIRRRWRPCTCAVLEAAQDGRLGQRVDEGVPRGGGRATPCSARVRAACWAGVDRPTTSIPRVPSMAPRRAPGRPGRRRGRGNLDLAAASKAQRRSRRGAGGRGREGDLAEGPRWIVVGISDELGGGDGLVVARRSRAAPRPAASGRPTSLSRASAAALSRPAQTTAAARRSRSRE